MRTIFNNPILADEYSYIRRQEGQGKYHRIHRWIFAMLAFISFAVLIAKVSPTGSSVSLSAFLVFTSIALLSLVYVAATAKALLRGFQAVAREYTSSPRWELFILSGIDARKLIGGKWAGVICSLWQDFVMLAAIRVVLTLGVGALYATDTLYSGFPAKGNPTLTDITLIIGSLVGLTASQFLFIAACGVLAASIKTRQASGVFHPIATWFMVVLGIGALCLMIAFICSRYAIYLNQSGLDPNWFFSITYRNIIDLNIIVPLTMLDNGIFTSFYLVFSALYGAPEYWADSIGMILMPVLYAFLTYDALRLSEHFAIRNGMSQARQNAG